MEIKKCPICDQNPKMKSCFFEEYGEYFLNFKCCNFEIAYHKNIFDAVKDWNNIVDKKNIKDAEINRGIDEKSSYYDAGGISTMDVIKSKLTEEQFKGFLLGNIIKYSCRLNHKDNPKRDAEKIANYSKILSEL